MSQQIHSLQHEWLVLSKLLLYKIVHTVPKPLKFNNLSDSDTWNTGQDILQAAHLLVKPNKKWTSLEIKHYATDKGNFTGLL